MPHSASPSAYDVNSSEKTTARSSNGAFQFGRELNSLAKGADKDDEGQILPLTQSQKELWVTTQLGPDALCAYNESLSLYLRGALKIDAMRQALHELTLRHEALRTIISSTGDYQRIIADLTLDVPLLDFSNESLEDREFKIAEWVKTEARTAFDLVHGPLIRAHILKQSANEHILVLTLHHIIFDGWSTHLLLSDLQACYTAACSGIKPALSPSTRLRDYVQWEASQQNAPEIAQAEQYWLSQFANRPPDLDLPTDLLRPAIRTFNGAEECAAINAKLAQQLKDWSSEHGCTKFMTLLTGHNLLLHYLADQEDIVVGIQSAGQLAAESAELFGFCVNLLPMRSQIESQQTLQMYAADVKQSVLNATEHRIYPFHKLLQKLKLARDPSRQPLINVCFNVDRAGSKLSFTALDVEVLANHNGFAKFDLVWNVAETPDGFTIRCEYNKDLFTSQTIQRWILLFETSLQMLAQQPEISFTEFCAELLQEDQQQQRLKVQEAKTQIYSQKFQDVKRPMSPTGTEIR